MEIILCFNFIILFFGFILLIVNTAFLVRISYFLVKMFDYMKAIGKDEDDEEYDEEAETSGLVNIPTVQDYVDEKFTDKN